jgi:hypothetical protein
MKVSDDYTAKIWMWAANPKVVAAPPLLETIPHFGHKSFSSHLEMNAWKEKLWREIAAKAPGDGRAYPQA